MWPYGLILLVGRGVRPLFMRSECNFGNFAVRTVVQGKDFGRFWYI